ncbi:lipolytic G-D-S-L family [Fusarium albosuccineum]|uniref:Lipolytic G-D-S-L family n=1 Tax=Fusarium albosuccineum TaxID=1237068 RepID=A0A8H4NY09_9HYPO|nr:lipolytic G-D-S-L family [Fusarium albosuccineum]
MINSASRLFGPAMFSADASGVGRRPEEIQSYDTDSDGKDIGVIPGDAGTSGNNIHLATLRLGGRTDFIIVDSNTRALGVWPNVCNNLAPELVLKDKPPVCNKERDYPGHVEIKYAYTNWVSIACEQKDIANDVGSRFKWTYTYHGV